MINAPSAFLRNIRGRIALRRADILGREQGQALVRVAITATVLGYLVVHQYPLDFSQGVPDWLIFLIGFLLFSLAVATTALRDQRSRAWRRVAANIADVVTVTFLMANTGESGAPLFAIYLWVTLGNGFRFGLTAMVISAVLSVAGFAVVMFTARVSARKKPVPPRASSWPA
ncbi:MAG: histidine kinase [Proteobacteria bacterium]|nr:histidine kinase [Pseudomonadota bacterium]